jgi:peptide/nickel transport system permease protein
MTSQIPASDAADISLPVSPAHAATTTWSEDGTRRKLNRPRISKGFGHSHLGVVIRRLMQSIPLFFLVTAFSFFLVSLSPSDPARQILGAEASPEAYKALRAQLGLNQPVWEQYWHWLTNLMSGNLGNSIFTGQSVTDTLQQRLPVTLSLIVCSLLVTVIVGVSVGIYSAVRGGITSRALDSLTLVGFSLPPFWVGAVLIGVFSVRLGWFPATGYVPFTDSPDQWARALVLPVAALAMQSVAAVARQTREAMLDILSSEYIRMARANGVPAWSLVLRHAMKNAGIRVVTILGLQTIGLLSGTVLVEAVFALPGLGSTAVQASLQKDLPVIQGIAALFTVLVILINIVTDLAYSWLNPKVVVK